MKKLILISLLGVCFILSIGSANANRLLDPNYNRCSNDAQLPPEQCIGYQEFAWNGGSGCITWEEYIYAQDNFIAPYCNMFDRTQFIGYCRCGCLARETQVFVERDNTLQWVTIDSIPGHEADNRMIALAEKATMSAWDYDAPGIKAMTIGPEEKPLVWIKTLTGLELGLTETHGVLQSNGFMIRAIDLKPGHVLVNVDGVPEVVFSVEYRFTKEDVYNVLTDVGLSNKAGHIIFANQLAVGDLYWQNILDAEFHRIAIRQ